MFWSYSRYSIFLSFVQGTLPSLIVSFINALLYSNYWLFFKSGDIIIDFVLKVKAGLYPFLFSFNNSIPQNYLKFWIGYKVSVNSLHLFKASLQYFEPHSA